jgi:hypothetical protein
MFQDVSGCFRMDVSGMPKVAETLAFLEKRRIMKSLFARLFFASAGFERLFRPRQGGGYHGNNIKRDDYR